MACTINVCAGFTTEPFEPSLQIWGKTACGGTSIKVHHCGFDTVMMELLSPTSTFASADAESSANVVFIRASAVKDELCDAIGTYNAAGKRATLIVVGCPDGPSSPKGSFAKLESTCNPMVGVWFAEAALFLAPSDIHLDPVAEKIGAMPYAQLTYDALGTVAARAISHSKRAFKAICVDCDNTLWQGVVGELAPSDMGALVGNTLLMERLAHAKAHGCLLITVSKNIEKDVLAAFSAHPEWPLKAADFVAHKVSYDPKSKSIIDVAAELQLSNLSDFCFLDDNPAEIGEVQANAPGVTCLHVPTERQDDYVRACWALDTLKATREDLQRTDMYKTEAVRQQGKSLDFGQWIASLDIKTSFAPVAGDDEKARLVQMAARTNQFNFTTERLAAFPEPPAEVILVRVTDKYGDYGIVGAIIFSVSGPTMTIANFMMSCRVLGRGVEQSMMARIGALATERGCTSVSLTFIPTERNLPSKNFLSGYDILPGDGTSAATKAYPTETIAAVKFDPGHAEKSVEQLAEINKAALRTKPTADGQAEPAAMSLHEVAIKLWEASGMPKEAGVVGATLEERIIDAVRKALGESAASALLADATTSLVSLGLNSLKMVQIKSMLRRELGELDITALQRAPTIAQWVAMSEGVGGGGAMAGSDVCMFRVVTGTKSSLAPIVFIHPAGGLCGPFAKLFAALGSERDIWAIEHPYIVDDKWVPKTTSIGELGTLYTSAIREKLGLDADPKRQWILSTFSAGGVYCNETFHQIRLAGTPPTALLLLDYGCGVIVGPWDVVTYCMGGCMPHFCCGGPCPACTCCATCLPCFHGATGCQFGDCGGLNSLGYYACTAICCLRQCQNMRYDPRNPKNNADQPWSYNPPETIGKLPPEGFRKGPGLQSAMDFYRMGYEGEMQTEKMPLPMVMARADKADKETMEQCAKLVGDHWNDKYGADFARGDKFERMAAVYIDSTVRSILPVQPGQSFKPVPWGDTPIVLFEAKGHPMQSLEHTLQLRPNLIHYEDLPVNLKMDGFQNLFAADPPPGRGHQFFLADDTVVKRIVEVTTKIFKERGW